MNLEGRLGMLERAADILCVTDEIISTRSAEGGDEAAEACTLGLPYSAGLYFGTVGALKLLRGETSVDTELTYINVLAANYALFLESIGAAEYKPRDLSGVEPGTVVDDAL